MDRKERVFAYISSKEYIPLKFEELMTVLDVPAEAGDELKQILDELCRERKIYITKKERYISCEPESNTVKGRLSCNAKGYFGFVLVNSDTAEDVFIKGDNMNGALNGDTVVVRVGDTITNGHREGYVIRVVERGNSVVVGVLDHDDEDYYYLKPDNHRLYTKIKISPYNIMDAELGDRVAAAIIHYDENGVYGHVISVLGEKDSLKGCIEGIIIEQDIKQDFDEETLENADSVSTQVTEEEIKNRLDLRDRLIFTIDGDQAKDFDDAVSLDILKNGHYLLGVHIADVTHYVTENSPLDREAFERGTSVYLADRVIPMLPERLSNGICSLNPHEDRLTLSVLMEIDKTGQVLSHRLEKAVINSKERMTYHNVTELLNGNPELAERYRHLLPTLQKMKELSDILENMRSVRGAIDFDFPESSVVVDENCEPIDIVREERGPSNKMIEEFMLTANETVAEYAYWSELPFVYRTHEPPSEDKIAAFSKFIAHFGLSLKGKIDKENPVHPKALQKILEAVKGTPEERMVASTMLHSLMKAEYKPNNLGHFGLSAKYYCHFTSPIRRYPDLTIHRILKEFMDTGLSEQRRGYFERFTAEAAKRSSETEINAERAERDVDDLMKTAYMSTFVGAEFTGVISGITGFGIFVELENSVEGLIRVENMTGDYFVYDDTASTLTGEKTGVLYRIGDTVDVVLMKANILARQIDFVLSQDASESMFRKFRRAEMLSAKIEAQKQYQRRSRKRFVKKRGKRRHG